MLVAGGSTLTTDRVELTDSKIELTVYPNPFADNFIVEIPNYDGQSTVKVELLSLSGGNVLVSDETYNQSVIEFADNTLATGVYVLKVSYNNGVTVIKKMIKTE